MPGIVLVANRACKASRPRSGPAAAQNVRVTSSQASLQEVLGQAPGDVSSDWIVGPALIEQRLSEGMVCTRIDVDLCANAGGVGGPRECRCILRRRFPVVRADDQQRGAGKVLQLLRVLDRLSV